MTLMQRISRTWPKLAGVLPLAMVLAAGMGGALALPLAAQTLPEGSAGETATPTAVVELYTAQGCASCPPADEMMLELAARDDVIALALHVDYWDYMGWVDELATPEFTQRQQTYARNNGHSTIYTPQVVLNGVQILEGYRVPQVLDAIDAELARRPEIALSIARQGEGQITINAQSLMSPSAPQIAMASRRSAITRQSAPAAVGRLNFGASGESAAAEAAPPLAEAIMSDELIAMSDFVVDLVRFNPRVSVDIRGGENAGRRADYANVVTSWQTIGGWSLREPLDMQIDVSGEDPIVVLIQEQGQGEIVAAAILR